MIMYDEDGAKLDEFDESLGSVEIVTRNVIHKYVVDVEEQGHYITIAEYPETGGKDVEWVVEVEEQGHWETRDAETSELVEDFDGLTYDEWPKDQEIPDVWEYGIYRKYTDEEIEEAAKEEEKAQSNARMQSQLFTAAAMFVQSSVATMNDEQAASVSEFADEWDVNVEYAKDDVRRYDSKLWRCVQGHTSQIGWEPPNAASLWYQIEFGEDGILVWRRPSGSHDAPNMGDLRHYPDAEGPVYESLRDGNTSEPTFDEWWKEVVQ